MSVPFVVSSMLLFVLGAAFAYCHPARRASTSSSGSPAPRSRRSSPSTELRGVRRARDPRVRLVVRVPDPARVPGARRACCPAAKLRAWRRCAILGIAIFAAVITPSSDPYTMLAMMIPMYAVLRGVYHHRSPHEEVGDGPMAIKGKGKPKSKPSRGPGAPARAGRGQAAAVPATLGAGDGRVRRRALRDVARRLGHERSAPEPRRRRRRRRARHRPSRKQLTAATAWQTRRSRAPSARSGHRQPGLPPDDASRTMSAAIDAMTEGHGRRRRRRADVHATRRPTRRRPSTQLDGFDLAGTIRDQGFDELQARDLHGLQGAADRGACSSTSRRPRSRRSPPTRHAIPQQERAHRRWPTTCVTTAAPSLQAGVDATYQSALRAGGVVEHPRGPIAGPPGGGA